MGGKETVHGEITYHVTQAARRTAKKGVLDESPKKNKKAFAAIYLSGQDTLYSKGNDK